MLKEAIQVYNDTLLPKATFVYLLEKRVLPVDMFGLEDKLNNLTAQDLGEAFQILSSPKFGNNEAFLRSIWLKLLNYQQDRVSAKVAG
jgi:hypothetical protein